MSNSNLDANTVQGFGEEWDLFQQDQLSRPEWLELCRRYFKIFSFTKLPQTARGFDMGCGSGRFALFVAPQVAELYCIDAAEKALAVARKNLLRQKNCQFILASVDQLPMPDNSMDFAYSLGVLHHIPNTQEGIRNCVAKLKVGAPFLLYLYYAFDQRPLWFKLLWRVSDVVRRVISHLPFMVRRRLTDVIALFVYWPISRAAKILEKLGMNVESLPLSSYRKLSFYTLRTDSLDRFGTQLEQRFTKKQIEQMMVNAGLGNIEFSDETPYWVAIGHKRAQ